MTQQSRETAYQIVGIKNLKMVNCYKLFDGSDALRGVMAYYEDKVINLCSADDHYPQLLERIAAQYAAEAAGGRIVADEETRRILDRINQPVGRELKERLAGYKETDSPLFLPKAFAHIYILPVIKFVIGKLYAERGDSISFYDLYRDWFGQGVLTAACRDERLHFPYRMIIGSDDSYEVSICNVLKKGDKLKAELFFEKERILLSFVEDAYYYRGEMIIDLDCFGVSINYFIKEGSGVAAANKIICEEKRDMRPTQRAVQLAAGKELTWKAFELPWGNVIFTAVDGDDEYRILYAEKNERHISRASVFRKATGDEEPKILFGRHSFMLYEQENYAEAHMLEMPYPAQADYSVCFAGRVYGA